MSAASSTAKKLPPHGTRQRYRLELKAGPGGKGGKACDRCKAANARAIAEARANRAARAARAQLTVVTDAPDTDTDADTAGAADTAPAEPGEMEQAVEADLAEIGEEERVPNHRSYSVLAKQLAREVDTATAASARQAASRTLFEVLKALRSRKEGGDGQSALDLFLDDFGVPLVPDGPS